MRQADFQLHASVEGVHGPIQVDRCSRQLDVKPDNWIGDTATCLRVAGEMIRDNVLYHAPSWAASPQQVSLHLSDMATNRWCGLLPKSLEGIRFISASFEEL
jgi:hypothetical protein